MTDETSFYTQHIKEIWKNDMNRTRQMCEKYKIWEFFDDYSYGESKNMGLYIFKDIRKNKNYLILFMEEGPRDEFTLNKLLQWNKSGIDNKGEIGHKGGGNLENIYGHFSNKTYLYVRVDELTVIRASTKPNEISSLVNSDISEGEFRNVINTNKYLNVSEILDLDECSQQYISIYDKIKKESSIRPGFIIQMELSVTPDEYITEKKWYNLVNEIAAKQYKIPIYVKNELINQTEYTILENIDIVGDTYIEEKTKKTINIYINNNKDNNKLKIFLEIDNNFYNINTGIQETIDSSYLIKWGKIIMFTIDGEIFKKNLKIMNKFSDIKYTQENFYGVYCKMNNKLVNIKPITNSKMGNSKNNKIVNHGTSRFRMIIEPNKNTCKDVNVLQQILLTDSIKAETKFSENNNIKHLIDTAMLYYRNKFPISLKTKSAKPMITTKKIKEGGIYIGYFGEDLYKLGLVRDYKKRNKRYNQHKSQTKEKLKEFGLSVNGIKVNSFLPIFEKKTKNYAGAEEIMRCELLKLQTKYSNIIKTFIDNTNSSLPREYFTCIDIDIIIQEFVPQITMILKHHKYI